MVMEMKMVREMEMGRELEMERGGDGHSWVNKDREIKKYSIKVCKINILVLIY
jgi:hypothetical protein